MNVLSLIAAILIIYVLGFFVATWLLGRFGEAKYEAIWGIAVLWPAMLLVMACFYALAVIVVPLIKAGEWIHEEKRIPAPWTVVFNHGRRGKLGKSENSGEVLSSDESTHASPDTTWFDYEPYGKLPIPTKRPIPTKPVNWGSKK